MSAEAGIHDDLAWWPESALPYDKLMPFVAHVLPDLTMDKTHGEYGWSNANG